MNLIYQYYHDWNHKDSVKTADQMYYVLSKHSIRKYAEKCEAEYLFIDDPIPTPFYGIFIPFQRAGYFEMFDNICFIDSDFLAMQDAENVFDCVANDKISINFMTTDRGQKYRDMLPKLGEKGHANSGIVNFPKALFFQFSEYVNKELDVYDRNRKNDIRIKDIGDYDQAFINLFLGRTGLYHKLPDKFNYHLGRNPKEKRWEQNLVHYHRKNKQMMITDYPDSRILK